MLETEVSGLYQPMSLLRHYLATLLRSAMLLEELCGLSGTLIGSSCTTRRYRHLPLRLCGENQTSVVLGEGGEDRLNTLVGVVAGLNTDLDSSTLDLSRVYEELEDTHVMVMFP